MLEVRRKTWQNAFTAKVKVLINEKEGLK